MNQIIVALDVDSRAEALNLVNQLKGRVGSSKSAASSSLLRGRSLCGRLWLKARGFFLT